MNTTNYSAEASPPASPQQSLIDLWSDDFVDKRFMEGVKPIHPPIAVASPVIALGSGFSAMLRGRAFAKSAKVLSTRKFGAALPMADGPQLSPTSMLELLEWAFRAKGSGPIVDAVNADRIRRRIKRALQQAHLLVVTFGTLGNRTDAGPDRTSTPTAADVCRDTNKIFQLFHRFAPTSRILFTIEPTPVTVSPNAEANFTASFALKATLRAGLEEFFVLQAAALNKDLFYFPVLELTAELGERQASERSIIDVFKAYYTSTGPTAAEAGRAFSLSRLRKLATARKTAPSGLALARLT